MATRKKKLERRAKRHETRLQALDEKVAEGYSMSAEAYRAWLKAIAVPSTLRAVDQASQTTIQAAAAEGGRPTFDMLAYSGGILNVEGFPGPVVVDLQALTIRSQTLPVHRTHPNGDDPHEVGHTLSVTIENQSVRAKGEFSADSPDVGRVVNAAKRGFPWVPSIGCTVSRVEPVPAGKTVAVNGRVFKGPVLVVRQATLREISFVTIGGDAESNVAIAAREKGISTMKEFEKWLQLLGIDAAALTAEVRADLQAKFDATLPADGDGSDPIDDIDKELQSMRNRHLAEQREAAAAERTRQKTIETLCAKYGSPAFKVGEQEIDLCAHAISEGWDADKCELEAIRAARPKGPSIHLGRGTEINDLILEAALCQALVLPEMEKQFNDQTLQAAHTAFRGRLGLQQMLLLAAAGNGYSLHAGTRIHDGNLREVLQHAFPPFGLQAAFSTVSLPGIFSNVANKELMQGYTEEDMTWREISRTNSVVDFKTHTRYRLLDNMEYEELGPAGEIKHGTVGEESYTYSAKTYAKMFALTRESLINDDLGAFEDLRTRLGRGAAKKVNNLFWTEFLDNGSFFTSIRGNYISGATTNLGIDGIGLEAGITAFRALKSPAADGSKKLGNRFGGRPELLLIPPELEFNAARLYQSTSVNTGGSATATSVPNDNIHAGKYRPVVCDWLSDSNFSGYSATAWYLFRAPSILSACLVSFLNGKQAPTVESAEADFNTLGVQFRGYHDFGITLADYLCGVKSKGAA